MKASGNGAPEICVQNLLKTIRGEVPYERIKGIDRTLIDKPSETAATDLAADVEFLVETYEPRVQLSDSDLKGPDRSGRRLRAAGQHRQHHMKEVNSVSDATNTYGEDIKLTTTDASTLYKTIITELERAPASRSTRATSAGSSARLSCPCSLPSTTASTTSAGRRSSAMRGARCWTPSASGRT